MGFNSVLVFPLQGVSVEAVDPVFQAKMLDMLKQTGRSETTCALYVKIGLGVSSGARQCCGYCAGLSTERPWVQI